jgi:Domain of unknown function (DUF4157)
MRFVLEPEKKSSESRKVRSGSFAHLKNDRESLPDGQHHAGNQAIQSLLRWGLLQPKLTIGSINDPVEREADSVATRIVGVPSRRSGQSSPRSSHQESLLQRLPIHQESSSSAPGIVEQVQHSAGRPLDPATRTFFEPRIGQDLGHIRVDTDQEASDSAHSIHALAYTVGRDIAFAQGRYSPHTDEGKRLLAHELVHTVQQSSRASSVVQRTPDLGGLTVSVALAGTTVPISGAKVHIDQKLVSSSKSVDLVTESDGDTPYIQLEEGKYTITVEYKCCKQVQDVQVAGNTDQMTFFEFGLCRCPIASTDQGGNGAVAAADSSPSAQSPKGNA